MAPDLTNHGESTYATKIDTLKVPGATLYHEVRGSGPVLLMIPGGPADAAAFAPIAPLLADRYTVVTYDTRGNSRSRLDGPPEDQRMEVHSDDAHRLLAALGTEPAYVFGTSSGAIVGLDLVARHPERVRALVAHEPPITELLPDAARQRAFVQDVYDTYRREGAGPAMGKFLAGAGLGGGPKAADSGPAGSGPRGEPSPEMLEGMARMQGNIEFFLAHMFRAIAGYVPDIARLRAAPTRIVVAVGDASQGQVAHRAGLALAEHLGTDAEVFPGDHGGYGAVTVQGGAGVGSHGSPSNSRRKATSGLMPCLRAVAT
jgi:pimeloyl-ACP methyl ester carboxylesterase